MENRCPSPIQERAVHGLNSHSHVARCVDSKGIDVETLFLSIYQGEIRRRFRQDALPGLFEMSISIYHLRISCNQSSRFVNNNAVFSAVLLSLSDIQGILFRLRSHVAYFQKLLYSASFFVRVRPKERTKTIREKHR